MINRNITKTQLEAIYLMNVALYISSYGNIFKFIQINKKCFDVVNRLKINPYFKHQHQSIHF